MNIRNQSFVLVPDVTGADYIICQWFCCGVWLMQPRKVLTECVCIVPVTNLPCVTHPSCNFPSVPSLFERFSGKIASSLRHESWTSSGFHSKPHLRLRLWWILWSHPPRFLPNSLWHKSPRSVMISESHESGGGMVCSMWEICSCLHSFRDAALRRATS